MRSLSAPRTVTGDEFWWEMGRVGDTRALACACVSLVVNDHRVLLQGSSGLYPAKVAEDASRRGRKPLRWCFKANNIAEMTSLKAVGWQGDNVFGNINRFRMFFYIGWWDLYLSDFFIFIFFVIIHTVKPHSYFLILLTPPAVWSLAAAVSQWISLEPDHVWAQYYSLFSKMMSGRHFGASYWTLKRVNVLSAVWSKCRQNIHFLIVEYDAPECKKRSLPLPALICAVHVSFPIISEGFLKMIAVPYFMMGLLFSPSIFFLNWLQYSAFKQAPLNIYCCLWHPSMRLQ